MTSELIAYLAGFLDGEGSISIARGSWRNARRGYTLHLEAKQVDRRPLDLLAARYGGSVLAVSPQQPRRQAHFRWGVVSRQAAAALRELLPYLIVKREQAALGIEFQDGITQNGGQPISQAEYDRRDRLVGLVAALKRVA